MWRCWGVYLIVARYDTESERKRLEYLLEKWEDKLKVKKPSGSIIMVDGDTDVLLSFLEELYSKVPREHIEVYKLSEPEFHLEPLVLEGMVESTKGVNEIWSVIDFIMARYHGVLVSEITNQKVYKVRTRKGECSIKLSLFKKNSSVTLKFSVEGYGEVVPYIYERLVTDFSYLGKVIRR